jgi:hypothetical protein
MLLADSAQVQSGKLFVLGGGWSVIGPDPTPSAIAAKIDVPWNDANVKHQWQLALLSDGQPFVIEMPEGPQPLVLEGEFEVGRPPGLRRGTPIDFALAINLGPLPLPPDSTFEWRLTIDGETNEDWTLPFFTRPRK